MGVEFSSESCKDNLFYVSAPADAQMKIVVIIEACQRLLICCWLVFSTAVLELKKKNDK